MDRSTRLPTAVGPVAVVVVVAVLGLASPAWAGSAGLPGTYPDPQDADAGQLDLASIGASASGATVTLVAKTYAPFTDQEANLGWSLDVDRDSVIDFGVVTAWNESAGALRAAVVDGSGARVVGPATFVRPAADEIAVSFDRSLIDDATGFWFVGVTLQRTNGAFEPVDVAFAGDPVYRFAGDNRVATAVKVSTASWSDKGATDAGADVADAVVLARADNYPDALAGTPLAAAKHGPLLLTAPGELEPSVEVEITRVLATGRTVYLLGGEAALSDSIRARLVSLGFTVVRFAGADRYATAVQVARDGLGGPSTVFLTTGTNFPDALSAGAAAASGGGAVLLTDGSTLPQPVQEYLASYPSGKRYAIGGPAAAADPSATAIAGPDRYETSRLVAETFFPEPVAVGLASGANFPDALAGGADIASTGGPLLLTPPDALPPATAGYLAAHAGTIAAGAVYGGTSSLQAAVQSAAESAIN